MITPPNATLANKDAALAPTVSAWVSASAGCGKTWLLSRRVLRLLLEGGQKPLPSILCLTYTKAGAAEMQNRIHEILANWAVMDEADLRDALDKEFGLKADSKMAQRAGRLFSHVLDTPDSVRVMTVHAYCQHILRRFPLEAGLSPHFTLLEGEAEAEFGKKITVAFLQKAENDKVLSQDLDALAESMGGARLKKLLIDLLGDGQKWNGFFERVAEGQTIEKIVFDLSGVKTIQSKAEILHAFSFEPAAPLQHLKYAANALLGGSKTDKKHGEIISAWVAHGDNRVHSFTDYQGAFLNQEGEIKKLFTKAIAEQPPDVPAILQAEAERVLACITEIAAHGFAQRELAFLRVAKALQEMVRHTKAEQGVLSYADLISETAKLLRCSSMRDWILYKLDNAIDHLLIDEAQDTNPEQWDIVLSLIEEFFAGEGVPHAHTRTVFVVGDEKQSIYSFQGAVRDVFLKVREDVLARFEAAGKSALRIYKHHSYRTVPAILQFVDRVFAGDDAEGVSSEAIGHSTNRDGESGFVELWPLVPATDKEIPEPWTPLFDRDDKNAAEIVLARRMASTIRKWLDEKYWLASEKRVVQPKDIMILVQNRSRMMLPIVRALKDATIPIAGVDRLKLREQPAVQDMLSLCRFLLLPQDDLALAEVLRGPLIRISEAQLYRMCRGQQNSDEKNLWDYVRQLPEAKRYTDYLGSLLARVDFDTPFALLNAVLSQACPASDRGGQYALTHRLGVDAVDPLEEMLSYALAFEAVYAPSLQIFVKALTANDQDIKRELSKVEGEVRILTVHSAKGLEAPIVFIPDLMRDPEKLPQLPTLFWRDTVPLCVGENDKHVPAMQAAKDAYKKSKGEEHKRLLYVALTRPRDVLILCGFESRANDGAKDGQHWFVKCRSALEGMNASVRPSFFGEDVFFYGDETALAKASPAQLQDGGGHGAQKELPEWAFVKAPLEKPRALLQPSQLDAEERMQAPQAIKGQGYARGRLLHQLLQFLPEIETARQNDLAFAFLKQQTGAADDVCLKDANEILSVLHNTDFAAVFSKGSFAEIPVAGQVGGRFFSGQIDRLVISDKEILIVDFKTNRPPPVNSEDVPEKYLAQMAAYEKLLGLVYPNKIIRSALLWTHIPLLMPLNAAAIAKGHVILNTILEKAA